LVGQALARPASVARPAAAAPPPRTHPTRRDLGPIARLDHGFSVKDSLKNDRAGPKSGHDACQETFSD